MNTTVTDTQVWQRWKEAKRLVLLATFEDSVTGQRVKEVCQGLSRSLGQQCQIIEHVWLFSTLRLRELQEIAAEEASVSNLVIISVHQAEGLPDEVKTGLTCGSATRGLAMRFCWRCLIRRMRKFPARRRRTCRTPPGGAAWSFWWNQRRCRHPAGSRGDS